MSDEPVVNGGGGAAVDVEITANEVDSGEAPNPTVQKLMQKLEVLEKENKQLVNDNDSSAEKINQLEEEIQSSESDKRALNSIAARAAELETEVSRLQHDLISAMSEGQESNAELVELKRVVEDLKKSESEKSEKIDVIEKERNLLLDRLNDSEVKLIESDYQIRQFETKIEGFEVRANDLNSEKLKIEEDAKIKISQKDEQIRNLNRKVEEFELVIEELKKEKDELQIGKNDLEAKLKISEMKVNELESKIDQLQQQLELNEKIDSDSKEKEVEKVSNSKVDWPVIAATTGAVALVAVVYFRHAKLC